jgi:asparagine synthase (glutamine-hydrolysing)
MCGICGIINTSNQAVESITIKGMNDLVEYRGPDDEGYFLGENFAFGHRRLAIIDLSADGHQPMTYRGRYTIIYNGEVYNYLELKSELGKEGYGFNSKTDTEVIMAAYDKWSTDCVEKFNGMWAFAIYDHENKTIFCSRDRFGIKPIYYSKIGNLFCFASEIKQFTAINGWTPTANKARVYDFLKYGIFDHTDETLFNNVFQLRGGQNLIYNLTDHSHSVLQWYDLKNNVRHLNINTENAMTQYQNLFSDSVRLRLRSDVKVGSCLSGGLDSSSIVCTMNQVLKNKGTEEFQETVSSCFDIKKYDEQEYIDEVIQHTGVVSHKVFPQLNNLFLEIDKIIWHQDEPFGSSSIYAQWHVFKKAKQKKLTVMLDGQGADEQLAGYFNFYGAYFTYLLSRGKFFKLLHELIHFKKKNNYSFYFILKNLLFKITAWLKLKPLSFSEKNNFLLDKHKTNQYVPSQKISIREKSFEQIITTSLPMLLHYEDRDSMAHSIESRVPFLDYRLVEFTLSLPEEFKIKNGATKWILRNSLKDIIPRKISTRYDKMGFVTPEALWLKENNVLFRNEFLNASRTLHSFIDYEKAQKYFDEQSPDNFTIGSIIWRVICLGRWVNVFGVELN